MRLHSVWANRLLNAFLPELDAVFGAMYRNIGADAAWVARSWILRKTLLPSYIPITCPAQIIKTLLQETADKELVVLHDLHSVLAASAPYEINQGIMQELAGAGLQLEAPATTTTVSDAGCWISA